MKTGADKKKRSVRVFSAKENQCIWMKAGVVNFKLCENAYDCSNCPFDKAMSRAMAQKPEETVSWRQAMRKKPAKDMECRHMLSGRVQYHFCSNGYRCNACELDQQLDEADLAAASGAVHTRKTSGFTMADGYYYHRGHSWARIEHGGFVRIGMDEFTLKLLGRPTEFRLPKLGSHLEQTGVGWDFKKEDKSAAMLSPIKGVVVATNHKVLKEPETTGRDPYGQGWLLVVDPQGLKQNLKNLLYEQEAAAWMNAEVQRLEGMVVNHYGIPLAATGGEIVDDISANLPDLKWEELVHEFLLT